MYNCKLREVREAAHMSQVELAHMLQVSRQTISSIENDKYKPTLILAKSICLIFNLTIDQMFFNEKIVE